MEQDFSKIVEYDAEANALYIHTTAGKRFIGTVAKTVEFMPGVNVDFARSGMAVGVEVLLR